MRICTQCKTWTPCIWLTLAEVRHYWIFHCLLGIFQKYSMTFPGAYPLCWGMFCQYFTHLPQQIQSHMVPGPNLLGQTPQHDCHACWLHTRPYHWHVSPHSWHCTQLPYPAQHVSNTYSALQQYLRALSKTFERKDEWTVHKWALTCCVLSLLKNKQWSVEGLWQVLPEIIQMSQRWSTTLSLNSAVESCFRTEVQRWMFQKNVSNKVYIIIMAAF